MSTITRNIKCFNMAAVMFFLLICLLLIPGSALGNTRDEERQERRDIVVERGEVHRSHDGSCTADCGEDDDPEEEDGEEENPDGPYDPGSGEDPGGEGSESSNSLTLRDVGLLQLAAHDFFNMDRDSEIDSEDGDLNLSTLLDHGDHLIATGGEFRNLGNIILFTVASQYGKQYLSYVDRGRSPAQARARLLRQYHQDITDVYEKLFGEAVPRGVTGDISVTENLAYRAIHDILPGQIEVGGEMLVLFDASLFGGTLTDEELEGPAAQIDGIVDPEFFNIVVVIPPDLVFVINLFERDTSFATQFGTDHSFEHFLSELEDGSFDPEDDVMSYIRTLFAKGFYID